MDEFDYIRKANAYFIPRTPAAALVAFQTGSLPVEGFVYKTGSLKPLYEEPVDLNEIERVLAKPDSNLETNLLLIRILNRLLKDPDPETALFAAESINIIENRYNKRIESLKKAVAAKDEKKNRIGLARQYFETAMLNIERQTIKNFYLHEAYLVLKPVIKTKKCPPAALDVFIEVLLELGLYDQALHIVTGLKAKWPQRLGFSFLEARIEFYRRRYFRVLRIFHEIKGKGADLMRDQRGILEFWCGE